MRKLTILLLVGWQLSAQTKIQEGEYTMSQHNGCDSSESHLQFPVIETENFNEADLRIKVSDSINSLIKQFRGDDEVYYSECDSSAPSAPDGYAMEYKIASNTDNLLSVLVYSRFEIGHGGHGADATSHCFNIDILKNKEITIGNLFNPKNLAQVENLMRHKKYTHEDIMSMGGMDDVSNLFDPKNDYTRFEGITIAHDVINFYFKVFMGNGIYQTGNLPMTMAELRKYIRKEYDWLCTQKTQKQ